MMFANETIIDEKEVDMVSKDYPIFPENPVNMTDGDPYTIIPDDASNWKSLEVKLKYPSDPVDDQLQFKYGGDNCTWEEPVKASSDDHGCVGTACFNSGNLTRPVASDCIDPVIGADTRVCISLTIPKNRLTKTGALEGLLVSVLTGPVS
jgi:hypothetical protein